MNEGDTAGCGCVDLAFRFATIEAGFEMNDDSIDNERWIAVGVVVSSFLGWQCNRVWH